MHHAGQLLGHGGRAGQQPHDRLPPRHQHGQQIVGVEDQRVELLTALREDAGDIGGALEQLTECLVAGVEGLRKPGDAVERGTQLRRNLIQCRRQRVKGLVECCGVGSLDVGRQVIDGLGQRVGRGGARHRDDGHRMQIAAARGFDGEHPLAQQRTRPDVCGTGRPEQDVALGGERHQNVAVLQRHARHAADFDSRHRHVVAGCQAAGIGEQRLVADRGRPLYQLVGVQPDGDDQRYQDGADESGLDEAPLHGTYSLGSFGSAHRPVIWWAMPTSTVRYCRSETRSASPHR